jgi:predicted nucleotidyltransferase
MAYIPSQLSALLKELTDCLPNILGPNLVGLYLYGSVTHGGFNPKRSDVDCIVVTERDLSDAQFGKLRAWLARTAEKNTWTARLQILFVVKQDLFNMDARACLYQFGVLKRTGWDGNPIIWRDFLTSGKVLFGPRPESFLPEITPKIFFQALEREIGYLQEEISEKPKSQWRDLPMYRAYAVLTVCRILYSFRKGTIVSKTRAGRLAIKYLSQEWHEIILQALAFNDDGCEPDIPLARIEQFIDFADAQLHPSTKYH